MKQIELTRGQFALVDDEDFEELNQYYWQAQPTRTKTGYYAVRNNGYSLAGVRLKVKMHREIMACPKGLEVDHRNGDFLNNCRSNLRICTHAENAKNQRKRKGSSHYKGVKRHTNYWRADIMVNYKRYFLGLFKTQEEAKAAYNQRALIVHGDFYNVG